MRKVSIYDWFDPFVSGLMPLIPGQTYPMPRQGKPGKTGVAAAKRAARKRRTKSKG